MCVSLLCVCRLDYPGVGPEHSFLKELGRAEYYAVTGGINPSNRLVLQQAVPQRHS